GLGGFKRVVTVELGGVNIHDGTHYPTEYPVESTAWAIKAGGDSDDAEYEKNIPLAVKRGLLTQADVNRALSHVLSVGFRLGAFDPPEMNPYSKITASVIRSPEHLQLSLQTALESMTL